jgi:hypothetical protein
VKGMKITPEKRSSQYRSCYELVFGTPRIYLKDISAELRINRRTAMLRMNEAFERKYIVGPEIRKRSFLNLREYMYFIKCENPEILYLELCEDPSVIYHAVVIGFFNFWLIAKEKMNIEGDVISEGYHSDYLIAFAPNHSWEAALQMVRKKIELFDPDTYVPRNTINTHFNEPIDWDQKDEALYRYFKYNLRKPFAPIMKKEGISGEKLYDFLGRLPECCTIGTSFYPETLSAYDPYLLMFETDYEDFIIDLFSELPTSSTFFKVADKLFILSYIPRELVRNVDLLTPLSKSSIPLLMVDLLEKDILKNKARSLIEYSWKKDI